MVDDNVLRDFRWLVRRTLQSLDAYWLHCDGLPPGRYPRGRYTAEDWWHRFEHYRALLMLFVAAHPSD
jgi:hypothetical protein